MLEKTENVERGRHVGSAVGSAPHDARRAREDRLGESLPSWELRSRKNGGAAIGLTRKGEGTKGMLVTDALGLPFAAHLDRAQIGETLLAETTRKASPRQAPYGTAANASGATRRGQRIRQQRGAADASAARGRVQYSVHSERETVETVDPHRERRRSGTLACRAHVRLAHDAAKTSRAARSTVVRLSRVLHAWVRAHVSQGCFAMISRGVKRVCGVSHPLPVSPRRD